MEKDTVLAMVNQLPSTFELEDLIEKLILIETIEAADKQIDKGEFYYPGSNGRKGKKMVAVYGQKEQARICTKSTAIFLEIQYGTPTGRLQKLYNEQEDLKTFPNQAG